MLLNRHPRQSVERSDSQQAMRVIRGGDGFLQMLPVRRSKAYMLRQAREAEVGTVTRRFEKSCGCTWLSSLAKRHLEYGAWVGEACTRTPLFTPRSHAVDAPERDRSSQPHGTETWKGFERESEVVGMIIALCPGNAVNMDLLKAVDCTCRLKYGRAGDWVEVRSGVGVVTSRLR